jgi:2-oxoglutarate dehydrogenase E2 component (dihydrolipoamide succinyltransferase)
MGESIAEGTLTTWYKKEGDRVERDENLFEISTDKVDAEIPSPAEGTLGKILVNEGETVEVGTVVATILQAGEVAGVEAEPEVAPEPEPEVTPEPATFEPLPPSSPEPPPPPVAEPMPAGAATVLSQPPERPAGDGRLVSKEELRRTRSSPLVRNIAAEHGIDLTQVTGTGLSGRVTKRDILAFAEGVEAAPAPPPAVVPEAAVEPVAPQQPVTPAAPVAPPSRPPIGVTADVIPGQPFSATDRVEIVPMSIMRQKIAEHMIDSRRTSAHVTSFFEFDMTRVAEIRARNKERFLEDSGVKLTYMPFIISALIAGVKEWPIVNASVWGDKIVLKKDVNVGIAVALPQEGSFGLLVPVIRHADELSLVGLARAANDLADRARTKRLSPEEVQGGTITITNPGVFGSLSGTPIINQPQVAILGVGTIEKRVKVIGPGDSIGVRTCAYFSLSYDHRVVDGATADHFMTVMKDKLENFSDPSLKE